MRWLLAAVLLLGTAAPALAAGKAVRQATCELSWSAPLTSVDGTALIDLKEYGLYIGSIPDLTMTPAITVTAAAAAPTAGTVAMFSCRGLAVGQYYAQVDAVDVAGNRSSRTIVLPFRVRR